MAQSDLKGSVPSKLVNSRTSNLAEIVPKAYKYFECDEAMGELHSVVPKRLIHS